MKSKLGLSDVYILRNKEDIHYGYLEVKMGFDIMKLKDMSLPEAVIYLEKENIPFKMRTGVSGVLTFKTQQEIEQEKINKEKRVDEI